MQNSSETLQRLTSIPKLTVSPNAPLSRLTRFGIGGPARLLVESDSETAFAEALLAVRESGAPHVVIGDGSNLIVSDAGFDGVVLRFTGREIAADSAAVRAQAGAELQALVDFTIGAGLGGIETMTGIPGSVGAAVYGNAGAYGHSISEFVDEIRFFDGGEVRAFNRDECEFQYRESIFKRRKQWVILSVRLALAASDSDALRRRADEIREIRDRKYPATMRCAGSIFKNLLLAELPSEVADQVPARVVREGKVPAAYFLEQVGAKGRRRGDIQVAAYHANLIYNDGDGTAADLRQLIAELKDAVIHRYGLELEEEVQYVGF